MAFVLQSASSHGRGLIDIQAAFFFGGGGGGAGGKQGVSLRML